MRGEWLEISAGPWIQCCSRRWHVISVNLRKTDSITTFRSSTISSKQSSYIHSVSTVMDLEHKRFSYWHQNHPLPAPYWRQLHLDFCTLGARYHQNLSRLDPDPWIQFSSWAKCVVFPCVRARPTPRSRSTPISFFFTRDPLENHRLQQATQRPESFFLDLSPDDARLHRSDGGDDSLPLSGRTQATTPFPSPDERRRRYATLPPPPPPFHLVLGFHALNASSSVRRRSVESKPLAGYPVTVLPINATPVSSSHPAGTSPPLPPGSPPLPHGVNRLFFFVLIPWYPSIIFLDVRGSSGIVHRSDIMSSANK